MQLATFIANFMVCLPFLSLCSGSPVGESISSSPKPYNARYSKEEESFIISELRRYPSKSLPIWGQEMWTEITKNHCKVRESSSCAFPPRTVSGLSTYFQKTMLYSKGKVPLPDDVMRRISKPNKEKQAVSGDQTNQSYPLENKHQNVVSKDKVSQGTHLREFNKINKKYTPEEDAFIINFVKNYPGKHGQAYKDKMWTEAAQQHKEMRKSNPSAFPQERTGRALRMQRGRLAQHRRRNNMIGSSDLDVNQSRYTEAEDDFIIEELLKPTCTSMYSASAWIKIKAEHDIRVQSKTPGFDQYRSVTGLKKRFIYFILKQKNNIPAISALKRKFYRNFPTTQDETDTGFKFMDGTTDALNAGNEDPAIWDMDFEEYQREFESAGEGEESLELDAFIEELRNAPVDVDFGLLKQKK